VCALVDDAYKTLARGDTTGGEDARDNRSPRPALADLDDRPVARQLLGARPDEPVRNVHAAGDEARVALVQLADVDQLDRARSEQPAQLLHADGPHHLAVPVAVDVAAELEKADLAQAARRALGLGAVGGGEPDAFARPQHEARAGAEPHA